MKNLLISNYLHNEGNMKIYKVLPKIYYSYVLDEVIITSNRTHLLIEVLNEKL